MVSPYATGELGASRTGDEDQGHQGEMTPAVPRRHFPALIVRDVPTRRVFLSGLFKVPPILSEPTSRFLVKYKLI
jgi:hypothetical protein